jgi:hypothetical protein
MPVILKTEKLPLPDYPGIGMQPPCHSGRASIAELRGYILPGESTDNAVGSLLDLEHYYALNSYF